MLYRSADEPVRTISIDVNSYKGHSPCNGNPEVERGAGDRYEHAACCLMMSWSELRVRLASRNGLGDVGARFWHGIVIELETTVSDLGWRAGAIE